MNVYQRDLSEEEIARGGHREYVGGLWREVGAWQLTLMLEEGLTAGDRMLDLGCGCLRGGVQFVRVLEPGNYFGIDCNASVLAAGLEIELSAAGLTDRLPIGNLLCDGDYRADRFGVAFDFVLAQSLWTHLPLDEIRRSLGAVLPAVRPGGRLVGTFFPSPEEGGGDADEIVHSPGGVRSFPDRDPFHYRRSQLLAIAAATGWTALRSGPRGHPRAQEVMVLERPATSASPQSPA